MHEEPETLTAPRPAPHPAGALLYQGIRMSVHFDPKLTWGHLIATGSALIFLGMLWAQFGRLSDDMSDMAEAFKARDDRISRMERRTSVLEAQRVEDDRRLDEIRDTVIEIRRMLDGRERR